MDHLLDDVKVVQVEDLVKSARESFALIAHWLEAKPGQVLSPSPDHDIRTHTTTCLVIRELPLSEKT